MFISCYLVDSYKYRYKLIKFNKLITVLVKSTTTTTGNPKRFYFLFMIKH